MSPVGEIIIPQITIIYRCGNLSFIPLLAIFPGFTSSDTVLLGIICWHRKCQFSSAVMTFLEVLSKKYSEIVCWEPSQ